MCLSVCWSHCCTAQKRLNDRDTVWGLTHADPGNHVVHGVEIVHGKRQSWRLAGPMHSIVSVCCGVRSKMDNSMSITAYSIQRDCRRLVSHHIVPRKKIGPLRCGLSSNFSDHLLFLSRGTTHMQRVRMPVNCGSQTLL